MDAGGKGETPGGKSGCSLAASTSMSSGGLLLLGLSVAITRRRRRERSGH
jgi:MYXO-CTERM domain-containing protein